MRDEVHPEADLAFASLQTGSALVPGIWWYEVRNILVLNERRGRIERADAEQFLLDLSAFAIEIRFPQDELQMIQIARKHKISIYDAAYLALAMREHLPLSTLDKDLVAAAGRERVELLV